MSAFNLIEQAIDQKNRLLLKAELALRHSLATSMGENMVPVSRSEKDRQAVAVLRELELHNGRPS